MNLFPVKLDLKPLVDAWGNGVRFVLWPPAGNALRFCAPAVQPTEAWAYQTNDVFTTAGDPVYAADLIPVSGKGVALAPCDYLGLGDSPVVDLKAPCGTSANVLSFNHTEDKTRNTHL